MTHIDPITIIDDDQDMPDEVLAELGIKIVVSALAIVPHHLADYQRPRTAFCHHV